MSRRSSPPRRSPQKGLETLGQTAADFGRKSFEDAQNAFKNFGEIRSATDFFKLQGDFARGAFDAAIAESARVSEAMLKIANDAAEPIDQPLHGRGRAREDPRRRLRLSRGAASNCGHARSCRKGRAFPVGTSALFVSFTSSARTSRRQGIVHPLSVMGADALFMATMSMDLLRITASDDDRIDDRDGDLGVATKTRTRTKTPSPYKVLMLNDDYTPMEFVVHVLQSIFKMGLEDATRVMLHVHQRGVGVCGIFPYEIAETKITQVIDLARENQHPLQCTLEKA